MTLDLLAIGAHPDDVELMAGGTLLKMAEMGFATGMVDMTRGERGTRGTPEIRAREARRAASILRLAVRENLALPDAGLAVSQTARLKVIEMLRRLRPKIVLTHFWTDPHPDHVATSAIVTDAAFLSGLVRIDTGQDRFRPDKLLYFMLPQQNLDRPSMIVDITTQFAAKMRACRAYRSQLYNPRSRELNTRLSTKDFLERVTVDHRMFGNLIQVKYGEAFYSKEPLRVDHLVEFFSKPSQRRRNS